MDPMASARRFVKEAAEGSATDVALGKLAQEKGSSDAVKQFGKRMVDDHSKATEELKQAAEMAQIAGAFRNAKESQESTGKALEVVGSGLRSRIHQADGERSQRGCKGFRERGAQRRSTGREEFRGEDAANFAGTSKASRGTLRFCREGVRSK